MVIVGVGTASGQHGFARLGLILATARASRALNNNLHPANGVLNTFNLTAGTGRLSRTPRLG